MSLEKKKLAVFHQLSQQVDFTTLEALLEKLDEEYVPRTVRRWLNKWIAEGLIEKQGEKRGTRYRPKDRSSRSKEALKSLFSAPSKKAIETISRPLFERHPAPYNTDWFNSYEPNKTFYIPLNYRNELLRAGKPSNKEDPAGTYARQIYNRLLIDLSYNSSRLEGNTYSLLDTEKLLLQGESAEGKLDEEKIMILNHKEAIRYLVDNAPRLILCKETVFTLHYLLSDALLEHRRH